MKLMKISMNLASKTDRRGQTATNQRTNGGLTVRTDLRAGLAWDDLDDKAQELWGNLTDAMSSLSGGADTSS